MTTVSGGGITGNVSVNKSAGMSVVVQKRVALMQLGIASLMTGQQPVKSFQLYQSKS